MENLRVRKHGTSLRFGGSMNVLMDSLPGPFSGACCPGLPYSFLLRLRQQHSCGVARVVDEISGAGLLPGRGVCTYAGANPEGPAYEERFGEGPGRVLGGRRECLLRSATPHERCVELVHDAPGQRAICCLRYVGAASAIQALPAGQTTQILGGDEQDVAQEKRSTLVVA